MENVKVKSNILFLVFLFLSLPVLAEPEHQAPLKASVTSSVPILDLIATALLISTPIEVIYFAPKRLPINRIPAWLNRGANAELVMTDAVLTIESIWKEGFLKSDDLVAPRVNDIYNKKFKFHLHTKPPENLTEIIDHINEQSKEVKKVIVNLLDKFNSETSVIKTKPKKIRKAKKLLIEVITKKGLYFTFIQFGDKIIRKQSLTNNRKYHYKIS